MNERKLIKFNLYMTFIVLVLLILFLVGTTIAYFSSLKQTNAVLTSGNVELVLTEANVKRVGDHWIPDPDEPLIFGGTGETVINDYGRIYPGQTIFKNPTITNTGDEAEWIAAKVTFFDGEGDLTKIMGYEGYEDIDIEILLSGGLLDEKINFGEWNGIPDVCHNDRYVMIQSANAAEGRYEFFFLMLQPVQPQKSVLLFDTINVPSEWGNAEMDHLKNLKIQVQAFGVQTASLDSCLKAMTEAFPTHFNF